MPPFFVICVPVLASCNAGAEAQQLEAQQQADQQQRAGQGKLGPGGGGDDDPGSGRRVGFGSPSSNGDISRRWASF